MNHRGDFDFFLGWLVGVVTVVSVSIVAFGGACTVSTPGAPGGWAGIAGEVYECRAPSWSGGHE